MIRSATSIESVIVGIENRQNMCNHDVENGAHVIHSPLCNEKIVSVIDKSPSLQKLELKPANFERSILQVRVPTSSGT